MIGQVLTLALPAGVVDSATGFRCCRPVAACALAVWLSSAPLQVHAQTAGDLRELSGTLEALSEKVRPSVVQIFEPGMQSAKAGRRRVGRCCHGETAVVQASSLIRVATSLPMPTSSQMLRESRLNCHS